MSWGASDHGLRLRGTALDRAARSVVLAALDRVPGGAVLVDEGDGPVLVGRPDADRGAATSLGPASVRVHDGRAYRRILTAGSVGLGESYADGWWDTDDLTGLLRVLDRKVRRADPVLDAWRRLTRPVAEPVRRLRRPDLALDRAEIGAHYDLGNAFFERLLDETMLYSCAVFDDPATTLADASLAKVDRLADALALGPDDHVLEIGTGWGGFAVRVAERYGCRVTTTTISTEQLHYARARVREAGLEDRITVVGRDFRQLDGLYDAIVSIEMIEAVDWREYQSFFEVCRRLLRPGGRLGLQAIVIPDQRFEQAKVRRDFIKQVIFPGGCLPSVGALLGAASQATDFSLVHLDDIGLHYAETLRRWRANLRANRRELDGMGLDERFARLWEFYLCYCEAGFDERDITDVQLVFADASWPPAGMPLPAARGRV